MQTRISQRRDDLKPSTGAEALAKLLIDKRRHTDSEFKQKLLEERAVYQCIFEIHNNKPTHCNEASARAENEVDRSFRTGPQPVVSTPHSSQSTKHVIDPFPPSCKGIAQEVTPTAGRCNPDRA